MKQNPLVEHILGRIEDALRLKNFGQMEHWACQWIYHLPKDPKGFLWLGRAAVAQKKTARAAYAYGRLLDFDPQNQEGLKFFSDHPSILDEQPLNVRQQVTQSVGKPTTPSATPSSANVSTFDVGPKERGRLAAMEHNAGETYERFKLYSHAAEAFQRSLEWRKSDECLLGAARCLHHEFRSFEATKLLRQELTRRPQWIPGRTLLGQILMDLGKKADAQREWQIVLRLDPNSREALGHIRSILIS